MNRKYFCGLAMSFIVSMTAFTSPATAQFDGNRFVRDMIGIGIGVMIDQASPPSQQPQRQQVYSAPQADPQLRQAQTALNELGYDAGIADGIMGTRTRNAIMDFQASLGESPTGTLTTNQFQRLMADSASGVSAPYRAPDISVLARTDIMAIQDTLNAAGYDAGTVDGVPGGKTRSALTRFLADNGQMPTSADAVLGILRDPHRAPAGTGGGGVLALTALAEGRTEPQAAPAPALLDIEEIEFVEIDVQYAAENPDLRRMIVDARPDLLTDAEFLSDIFRSEGRTHTSSYRVEEELEAFRVEYLARPVPERVYLDLVSDSGLRRSEYNPETGLFPLSGMLEQLPDRFLNLSFFYGSHGRQSLQFDVPEMPDIDGIPMTLEEAETFERDRFDSYDDHFFVHLHRKVEINDLAYNETRGVFEGGIRLFGVEAREAYGDRADELLHAWHPVAENEVPSVSSAVATLEELSQLLPDIELVGGHLDIIGSGGWPRVAAALRLTAEPAAIDHPFLASVMARALLTNEEQVQFWRGDVPYDWEMRLEDMNSEQFQYAFRVVHAEYAPLIAQRAIETDLRIVEVREVRLGAFDSDRSTIPFTYMEHDIALADERFGTELAWSLGNTVFPEEFEVDTTLAQTLIAQFDGDPSQKTAYVAIFADVADIAFTDDPQWGSSIYGTELGADVTRIALFADRGLENLVFDFYADPESALLQRQREEDELLALLQRQSPSVDVLHKYVADNGDELDYLEQIIAATVDERNLNEFERADFQTQMASDFARLAVPETIWMNGELDLGEYDTATGAFRVRWDQTQLGFGGSVLGLDGTDVGSSFLALPAELPIPMEQARAFVENRDSRDVPARFLLTPVIAKVEHASYGDVQPTITYHLERLVALVPSERSRLGYEIFADVDYGPFQGLGAAAEQGPIGFGERPIFTQELAAILAFNASDAQLSDADFRRLLASRWLAEQDLGFETGIDGRFFSQGASLPSQASLDLYRDDFETWLRRAAALEVPTKLRARLNFDYDILASDTPPKCSDMEWGFYYVSQNYELLPILFGEDGYNMPDLQRRFMQDGTDTDPAIVDTVVFGFPHASLAACRTPQSDSVRAAWSVDETPAPQSAFLVVDSMPMPDIGSSSAFTEALLDVEVTDIVTLTDGDGLPTVLVHASFESVDFVQAVDEDDGRRVLASAHFDREALVPEVMTLDVLGLMLGMDEDEADKLVRAHLPEPMVLNSAVQPSLSAPRFDDVTMYVGADLKERIALVFQGEPGRRTVAAIHRLIVAPDWSLPRADVAAGVKAKYGQPAFENHADFSSVMAWGPSGDDDACRAVGNGALLLENWSDETGRSGLFSDFMEWNYARDSRIAYVPEPQWSPQLQRCGGLVLFEHQEDTLVTLMVNPAVYYAQWQAASNSAAQALEQSPEPSTSPVAF